MPVFTLLLLCGCLSFDGKTLGGMTDKVIIGSEDVSAELALNISLSSEIVFKEIYSGGQDSQST